MAARHPEGNRASAIWPWAWSLWQPKHILHTTKKVRLVVVYLLFAFNSTAATEPEAAAKPINSYDPIFHVFLSFFLYNRFFFFFFYVVSSFTPQLNEFFFLFDATSSSDRNKSNTRPASFIMSNSNRSAEESSSKELGAWQCSR